jgi:uncharacterized damage-inducible protein DinB
MFTQTQFQTLFTYHWYVTWRLLECAGRLSEADYLENTGYGHGSVHTLLLHVLRTDRGWRMALETGHQSPPLYDEEPTDLSGLQSAFADEQAAWQALLQRWSAAEIEGNVKLATARGQTATLPLWRVLQHLVLHGMQHHTEVAQLLTAKGESPGDIDFIFFE